MTLGGQARRSYVVASILQGIHETLPLSGDGNFVAPIALLALGMRTAILPLVWLATKENGKLAKVIPEIQMMHTLYKKDLDKLDIKDTEGRKKLTMRFVKGAQVVFKIKNVKPYMPFVPVLAQFPLFILFASELRGIINSVDLETSVAAQEVAAALPTGGVLWFTDLTTPDSTSIVLPAIFAGLLYTNLEVALGTVVKGGTNVNKTNIVASLKSFLQQWGILLIPVVSTMPSGLWVYLSTSSVFSAGQIMALKSNALRRAVGLPLLGEKHVPTLYKEMQEELARKQKAGGAMGGGGGGAGAGAGAGVMTEEARELMNKREMQARKLVEGYKPAGHGILKPGVHSFKVGRPIKSTIVTGEDDTVQEVPDSIIEMANKGELMGSGGSDSRDAIILSDEELASTKPTLPKRLRGRTTKRKGAKGKKAGGKKSRR